MMEHLQQLFSGLVDHLQKKAVSASNLKGAFGSSSARVFTMRSNTEDCGPGPQAYTLHSAPQPCKPDKRSSVFKSSTTRLTNVAQQTPAPGENIDLVHSYISNSSPFLRVSREHEVHGLVY